MCTVNESLSQVAGIAPRTHHDPCYNIILTPQLCVFDDNTSGVVPISPGISSTSHRLWNRYTARSRRSQDCRQLGILRSSSTTPLITSTCSLLARCLASTHLYGRSTYISFVLTISIPGNPSSFPAHFHRFPLSNIPRNPVSRTPISQDFSIQNSSIPGLKYPKT